MFTRTSDRIGTGEKSNTTLQTGIRFSGGDAGWRQWIGDIQRCKALSGLIGVHYAICNDYWTYGGYYPTGKIC